MKAFLVIAMLLLAPAALCTDDIAISGGIEAPTVFQKSGTKGLVKMIHECKGIAIDGCAREICVRLPPNKDGESKQIIVDGYKIVSKDLDDPPIPAGSSVVIWRHMIPCDKDERFNAALKAYIKRREASNQSGQGNRRQPPASRLDSDRSR